MERSGRGDEAGENRMADGQTLLDETRPTIAHPQYHPPTGLHPVRDTARPGGWVFLDMLADRGADPPGRSTVVKPPSSTPSLTVGTTSPHASCSFAPRDSAERRMAGRRGRRRTAHSRSARTGPRWRRRPGSCAAPAPRRARTAAASRCTSLSRPDGATGRSAPNPCARSRRRARTSTPPKAPGAAASHSRTRTRG